MKKLGFLLFFFSSLLVQAGVQITLYLQHESVTRSYVVHLPDGYTNAISYPVVFNLHGLGSDGPQQLFYSQMYNTADSNKFIAVFPNGLSNSWNSGFQMPYNSTPDDVGFISKIIDTLNAKYSIDLNRVYACGMSNGGFQSHRLACDLENRIAAIASVTGSITTLTALNCNLSRKVPMLQIHGTADPLVDYNGATGYYSMAQCVSFWVGKNQCTGMPDTTYVPDINPNDSSTVMKIKYKNCADGTEVWFYHIEGGGHTWPNAGIDYIYGPTNRDIDGSQEIWDFFKKFTQQGSVGILQAGEQEALRISPNPAKDFFVVEHLTFVETMPFSLYDALGRLAVDGKLTGVSTTIAVGHLPKGIYVLHVSAGESRQSLKVVLQ